MGKHTKDHNKPHRKHKDKREHKERSKKEHLLKKDRKQEKLIQAEIERTRYTLDPHSKEKVLRAIKELVEAKAEAREELLAVFQMIDEGMEMDIADIEEGFARDRLETILLCLSSMVERVETPDGRFVFRRSCLGSVKEQVENYLKSSTESVREEWMTGMTSLLQDQIGPELVQEKRTESGVQEKADLEGFMEEYNRVNRPKSLMEIHREQKGGKMKAAGERPEAYLYGHKTLDKRFGKGSFHTSFM